MNRFLDNTGFHAVGRCLSRKGVGEIDVRGLLQFATELVFSERLVISGFEIPSIKECSEALRSILVDDMGLEPEAINIAPYEAPEYGKACEEAGKTLFTDLRYLSRELLSPPQVPPEALKPYLPPENQTLAEMIYNLVTKQWDQSKLQEIARDSLKPNGAGSVPYTLLKCPGMLEQVRTMAGDRNWSPKTCDNLIAAVRCHINAELAKEKNCAYSPAVARAELLRKANRTMVECLAMITVDAARSLLPRMQELPHIGDALIKNAKGDPKGVISEAITFRSRAAELRAYLAKRLRAYQHGTDDWCDAVSREGTRLARALQVELNPDEGPRLRDAIQLQLLPPFFSIDPGSLDKWAEHRRVRRHVIVLAGMAKAIAFGSNKPHAFKKLVDECCSAKRLAYDGTRAESVHSRTTPDAVSGKLLGSRSSDVYHYRECAVARRIAKSRLVEYESPPSGKRLHKGCPS